MFNIISANWHNIHIGIRDYVVWLNLKNITFLVSRWRSSMSIWIMEKFQDKNINRYLIKSSQPPSKFVLPTLLDANNYWNDFCQFKRSNLKYGYLAIGKQFHASIFIKANLQAKNHNRRKVNRQCTKFQMGMLSILRSIGYNLII